MDNIQRINSAMKLTNPIEIRLASFRNVAFDTVLFFVATKVRNLLLKSID
jgi:hypothetical protein